MNDQAKAEQIKRTYPEQTANYSIAEIIQRWKSYSDDLEVEWAYPDMEGVNIVFGYQAPARTE